MTRHLCNTCEYGIAYYDNGGFQCWLCGREPGKAYAVYEGRDCELWRPDKVVQSAMGEYSMCRRESGWSLAFWLKLALTLGLYLFWWSAKYIVVTNTGKVECHSGVLSNNTRSALLSRITDVSVRQGPFGRMFGYGHILIETAGGPDTEIKFSNVAQPNELKDLLLA